MARSKKTARMSTGKERRLVVSAGVALEDESSGPDTPEREGPSSKRLKIDLDSLPKGRPKLFLRLTRSPVSL